MHSLQKTHFHLQGRAEFAKLFPELPAFGPTDDELEELANRMVEHTKGLDSRNVPNGIGIFGQFLAHDITFEVSSRLKGPNEAETFRNDRTYQLDLDCLYGQWTQDFLYDTEDRDKLLLGKKYEDDCDREWYDLQRNAQCKAIIPDARNDENIIVSRMQVLFIDLHNCMVDEARKAGCKGSVFQEARRQTTWIYHWLIVHEYLAKLLDEKVFDSLITNGPQYFPDPCFLPLEFTGAAFRFGHSQTRDDNRINEQTSKNLFELGVFETMDEYVDWHYLFNFGDMKVQPAKKIDTKIPRIFHDLPFIKSRTRRERSLVWRNLKRGKLYGLPCGEDVAHRMGIEPLKIAETKEMGGTPLWYYILKEAEVVHSGERLGHVGSTLLGEVFFSLMQNHDWSYLKLRPLWQPASHSEKEPFDFAAMIKLVYGSQF